MDEQKANGIFFSFTDLPEGIGIINIAIWDSNHPHYLKAVTNGGIIILKAKDWQMVLNARERQHFMEDKYVSIQEFVQTRRFQRETLNPTRTKKGLGDACWDCRSIARKLCLED